jgi:heat shock 70kDa protein 4
MDINGENILKVRASVVMPGSHQPTIPVIEATMAMPMIDDGHGWCVKALNRTYGDTMDLVTLLKK